MILLIDNYDSFSYNLFQLIGSIEPNIKVVRNDALSVDEIAAIKPQALVISPGPGRPEDAGICIDAIKKLKGTMPILGVCLGHQAICAAYGATVSYAKTLMHGKQSVCTADATSALYNGLPEKFKVARYHSLAAVEDTMPDTLKITGRADDGEIMSVEDTANKVFGLQYHPESIMTPDGKKILSNFISLSKQ